MNRSRTLLAVALAAMLLAPFARAAEGRAQAWNMRLLAHAPLDGRGAFHTAIEHRGARWLAYVGHMGGEHVNSLTGRSEPNGTSVLDVTDPHHPRYLAHIPGEPGREDVGGARSARICGGAELPRGNPAKTYLLRPFGNSAFELWDVGDPAAPARVSTVVRGLSSATRSWWECTTGYAFLVVGDRTWRAARILHVYDLSDPSNPVFVRSFGLPGQEPGSVAAIPFPLLTVRSTGPLRNRVYLGYGQRQGGVLQIVDRDKLIHGPREQSAESLLYPQISRHELPANATANMLTPLLGMDVAEFRLQAEGRRRDFIAVTGRSIFKECREARQMVWFVDTTAEYRPYGVSTWTVPEESGHFCSVGGRFGAQSANENFPPVFAWRLLFIAHMNAGVRVLDIRNPFRPLEVAHYIPAVTKSTVVLATPPVFGRPVYSEVADRPAVQTDHAEVDSRGYVYIVDRAGTGMHILELTGPARAIADWSAAAK